MNEFLQKRESRNRLLVVGKEQIPIYVEKVKYLLKLYATDFNITERTQEIKILRKTTIKSTVKLAEILFEKVISLKQKCSKKCSLVVLIDE